MSADLNESIIKKAIEDFNFKVESEEIGKVTAVYDGIVIIAGLNNVQMEEIVEFRDSKIRGIVMSMDEFSVTALVLGDFRLIKSNEEAVRTKKFLTVKVSDKILGKVVNGYGEVIDNSDPIKDGVEIPVDNEVVPMIERAPVTTQLETGVQIVDSLIPIGLGQRQLILGDMNTGKTSIPLSAILNNKNNKNMVFVYVSIGQKVNNCSKLLDFFQKNNVTNFVIVKADTSSPASMRYLAPMVGCAIAEYFRDHKKHAVITYDNLNSHAIAYREISLIMKRPPGREAYPGDIFYQHAKLLERAAQTGKGRGSGSLTALPIIEINDGDVSGYISTNVISITDGQIILSKESFNTNVRPAINIGLSVSRIGSSCQKKIIAKLSGSLKIELAQYENYVEMTRFSSNVSNEIKAILERGALIKKMLKQDVTPKPLWKQALLLYGVKDNLFSNEKELEDFENFINSLDKHADKIMSSDEHFIKTLLKDFGSDTKNILQVS